jgi:hypothetical protein
MKPRGILIACANKIEDNATKSGKFCSNSIHERPF